MGSALLGAASALDCSPSAIQAVLPSNASVNFAYNIQTNGTFQVPKGDTGYPTNPVGLPALCAVSVQVQSVGNTTFGFGLFLPENWNGRFLAVGNGGFAGGINWLDMVRLLAVYSRASLTKYRLQEVDMASRPCLPILVTILLPATDLGHTNSLER